MVSPLLELPAELINFIVEIVYIDGCRFARAILPLCSTCKELRRAANPFLFHTLTIETIHSLAQRSSGDVYMPHKKLLSMMAVRSQTTGFHIVDHVQTLKFVCECRGQNVITGKKVRTALNSFLSQISLVSRLHTVIFDPPDSFSHEILEALNGTSARVILDYRHHSFAGLGRPVDFSKLSRDITWGISCEEMHDGTDLARSASAQVKAFHWSYPARTAYRDDSVLGPYVELLNHLQFCPLLEELHLSEAYLDSMEFPPPLASFSSEICGLSQTLPLLRRLHIEGSILTECFLKILPTLNALEDLSIYSIFKRAFHKGCDDEDAGVEPASTMPWLELPKLRKLELKFVCKHFTMGQLIPKGLVALRIEFYGIEDRLMRNDLEWLARHCPGLERLELDADISPKSRFPVGASLEPSNNLAEGASVLSQLQRFRKLRTLRLFASYWRNGKLLPHPFESEKSILTTVTAFLYLRSKCPDLNLFIITISSGEYPFDVVSRMSLTKRPAKFVLRNVGGRDDTLIRWGYAGHCELYEIIYKGQTAMPSFTQVSCSREDFFDDLHEDWILPQCEIHTATV